MENRALDGLPAEAVTGFYAHLDTLVEDWPLLGAGAQPANAWTDGAQSGAAWPELGGGVRRRTRSAVAYRPQAFTFAFAAPGRGFLPLCP